MLDYNRIAYELDGLEVVPADIEGLSMIQHFDYPEEWHYNGNAKFSDSTKFGKGCVYFPDTTSSVSVTNTLQECSTFIRRQTMSLKRS